ncbi:hypothetical protein FHX82_006735 [Amycolatopsis bartoniae]|uniref:IniB N-terminal domain-containing protein n=1 Tax=Amycolatopsis bartoniae TaxID=941986 RepID=UPI0011913042|nr:IniB N-terminal domain-containing protein [Amycolatopsis bartoniae]MBB2939649.1 hypothetical protein [Amycolatopsis bartoniae]TVT08233.1 hypothetical protein FNH07_13645 [Amycolatopsis bartoniae]
MSQPIQTLHEFVLSLVSDGASQSAFLSDPQAVLAGAGLSDITAGDVQEVTALVVDHAPAPVADAVEAALAALPADGPDDLGCAIEHLKCVATTVPAGLGSLATATSASADGFAGSAAYTGSHLDATLAGAASTGGVSLAGDVVSDVAQLSGSVAAGGDSLAASLTGGAGDATFAGALAAGDGAVAAAAQSVSPLGTYALATDGLSLPDLGSAGDLGSSLDAHALGDTSPVVDAASGYTDSIGSFAAGTVSDGSTAVAGYLSPAGSQVAGAVAQGGSEVAQHLDSGTAAVSGALSHVPAVPAPNLPVSLPTDLPVHVTAELPHSLPDVTHLPDAAHDVVATAQSATSGVVAHSPVADLGSLGHTAALPDLGDALHTDLPLGH